MAASPTQQSALSTQPYAGLTTAEAARRLARHGPNEVPSGHRFWAAQTLLGFFANPLVLILLAASIVSGLLGEPLNATLITLMIGLSVALDFFQVFRSQQAAAKLEALIPATTTVWRDGRPRAIARREVVPDDLLDLRAGDLIAADATLLAATTLSLDEAAMTGESLPVEKRPLGAAEDEPAPENVVLAGTSVVSGVGQARVTATGARTQFGAIAHGLAEKAPPTAFELGTHRFGFLIMRTVIALVLFVFLVNALLRRDPLESFLFALALAVGFTPLPLAFFGALVVLATSYLALVEQVKRRIYTASGWASDA